MVAGINFQLCELGSHYRISPSLLRIKERKERKNKVIVPLDMTKRPYIPQQDVSYMAGYGVAIKNSFLNLVPPRGTGWRFKSPPHPIHTRCRSFIPDRDPMTELKEILEKSLIDDSCMSVTIHCNVPKLTVRITDSRQMFIYGIGLDKQQGFTLNIGIDKNSNKGKQLREKLDQGNSLTDFKTFEDKRSMIYLKDFRQEIELLEKAIHDILDKVDNSSSGQSYQLTANRTDGNYTIE